MNNSTCCIVEGCGQPRRGKAALCSVHWQRVYRDGETGDSDFRRSPGSVAPECSVSGCDRPVRSYGMCAAHRQRVYSGSSSNGPIGPNRKSVAPACKIDECRRQSKAKGWCNLHYQRWLRTGDPLGQRAYYGATPTCTVDGCDRKYQSTGYCDTHYRRWRRGWDIESLRFRLIKSRSGEVSYQSAHMRMRTIRGPASEHVCQCGEAAAQWAYQHNDADELSSPSGMPYSLKFFECYEPMCLSCHGLLDCNPDERRARKAETD